MGVIGCGNMGGAIVDGILTKGALEGKQIGLCDQNLGKLAHFASGFGTTLIAGQKELAAQSKMILLGVKPQFMGQLLNQIKDALEHRPTVVSIAAGLSIETIASYLPTQIPIVRVMPNLNARLGEAISGIAGGKYASDQDIAQVSELFEAVGEVSVIDEAQFAVFSALGGCSPAWTFRYIDALATQAVALGFTKEKATRIAAQAVLGSAKNVLDSLESSVSAATLIDQVCSPAGTTVAGLLAMEDRGFSRAVREAVKAAVARDQEL